jgi:DUF438 domain-containing protein
MEEGLLDRGFSPEIIQYLCDLHALIFDEALEKTESPGDIPGHPVYNLREEIRLARDQLMRLSVAKEAITTPPRDAESWATYQENLDRLKEIEKHYRRLENLLLPAIYTENLAPVIEDMRARIESVRNLFKQIHVHLEQQQVHAVNEGLTQLSEVLLYLMDLEERILLPSALKTLSDTAWADMKKDEGAIGYAWIQPGNLWDANLATVKSAQPFGKIESHRARKQK